MIRKYVLGAVALVLALSVAGPAFAEGSWVSFYDGARVGKESRRWVDKGLNDNNTVVKFIDCTSDTRLELWRDDTFTFDNSFGQLGNPCFSNGSADSVWGNPGAGNNRYYFEIVRIANAATINVARIEVSY